MTFDRLGLNEQVRSQYVEASGAKACFNIGLKSLDVFACYGLAAECVRDVIFLHYAQHSRLLDSAGFSKAACRFLSQL